MLLKLSKKICGMLILLLIVNVAFASDDDNRCEYLNIQIANATSDVCTFVGSESSIDHGRIISPIPLSILPGGTAFFKTHQIWGNQVTTTYSCGGKKIKLVSKQTYCFISAGRVKAYVAYHDKGINARYSKKDSSAFWDTSGSLDWTLFFTDYSSSS